VVLSSIDIGAGLVLVIMGGSALMAWRIRRYTRPTRGRFAVQWILCAWFGMVATGIGVGAFQVVFNHNAAQGFFAIGAGAAWLLVAAWLLRRHRPA